MAIIVKIIGAWNIETPHDGRYVVSWDANVPFGDLHVVSTDDPSAAKAFDNIREALEEYEARSDVEPNRPNDGRANRPLTALTIEFETVK